jgi:hypothetical protein
VTVIESAKERWFEAEVYRISGKIALKSSQPDTAKAEASFERALAIARQQRAKSFEHGQRLLELAGLSLEFLDLVRGRLTRRVASQPLLAGLQKLLRPTIIEGKAPEPWQREVLKAIRDGLPLGKAIRLAIASGHGIGKTALVSWICLWAMSTCTDCRGILTASNEAQLATRNRAELRKWFRLFHGRVFFDLTATALISADSAHEQTWRLDLLPWNEHRQKALPACTIRGDEFSSLWTKRA